MYFQQVHRFDLDVLCKLFLREKSLQILLALSLVHVNVLKVVWKLIAKDLFTVLF